MSDAAVILGVLIGAYVLFCIWIEDFRWWDDDAWQFSSDECLTASLQIVFPGGTKYATRSDAESAADRYESLYAELREKYKDYGSPRMRRFILDWIDYAESNNKRGRREIKAAQRVRELKGRLQNYADNF